MHKHALLAIIGGGNMGKAIALGALDAKLLAPGEIVICEAEASKRAAMAGWGVQVVGKASEAVERLLPVPAPLDQIEHSTALAACGGQVLLAVKPQSLDAVATELRDPLAAMPRVVISILAGTPTSKIARLLGTPTLRGGASALGTPPLRGGSSAVPGTPPLRGGSPSDPHQAPESATESRSTPIPIIRVMPNTPARLRKSMTAMCLGAGANSAHGGLAYDLFASIGEVVKIDESLMDAFTAVSGSGPAYVFYLAQAMVKAAQEVGFDRITADRIVRQTIAGASALLADSNEPPEALRAAVTSKGGTTEAAVGELDRAKVIDSVVAAIVAGRDRGRQLAG